MLLTVLLPAVGCSAPQTAPLSVTSGDLDHPEAPLPPGLDARDVAPHAPDDMARALTPFEAIITSLVRPDFLREPNEVALNNSADSPINDQSMREAQRAYAAAQQLRREGRVYEAIQKLSVADRLLADQPTILHALGDLYLSTGNRVRGREYLQRAVELDPRDRLAVYKLGALALRNGEEDIALSALAHVVSLTQPNDGQQEILALAHFRLAQAMQLRRYDRAALLQYHRYLQLSRSLSTKPSPMAMELRILARDQNRTLMQMGDLYARLGQSTDALRAYQQAQHAEPDHDAGRLARLVYIHLRLDQRDQSVSALVDYFRQASDEDKTPAEALELARFLAKAHPNGRDRLISQLLVVYREQNQPTDLAITLADLMKKTSAKTFLQGHLTDQPDDDRAFERLLALYLGDADDPQRFDRAVKLAADLMADDEDLIAWRLAKLFDAVDDLDKLPDRFSSFEASLQQNKYVRLIYGECLARLERWEAAQSVFESLIKQAPNLTMARITLAFLQLKAGEPEAALRTIEPAADPRQPRTIELQVAALMDLDRSDQAIALLDETLRRTSNHSDLIIFKARVQIRGEDFLGAERTLVDGINLNSRQKSLYHELLALYEGPMRARAQTPEKFRELAQKMYANLPQSRTARLLQARLLLQKGDLKGAVALMRAVLRDHPSDLTTLTQLAEIYIQVGRPELARQLIQDGATKLPQDDPDAQYRLAAVCVMLNEHELAESIMLKLLEKHPDHPGANNDLGYTWVDKGVNLDRALKMIRIAVESDPDNPSYLDSLGWAYYKLGRFEEATVQLQRAAELKADPIVLDHLGDARYRNSDAASALSAWRDALSQWAKFENVDEPYRSLGPSLRAKIEAADGGQKPALAPLAGQNDDEDQATDPSPDDRM